MPIIEYECSCGKRFERYLKRYAERAYCDCGQSATAVLSRTSPPVICGPLGRGFKVISSQDKATGSEFEYALRHADPGQQ